MGSRVEVVGGVDIGALRTDRSDVRRRAGRAAAPEPWTRPPTLADQEAVGLIAIVSFLGGSGSGIVTSITPSCVLAVICPASTPAGSVIERKKDPYRRSRRMYFLSSSS